MAEMPGVGAKAPDFQLERDGGGRAGLADFKGRKLVLYFYPKDDTSGCTTEAKDFSALTKEFGKAGAVVVGVSPDPARKHDRFKAKHELSVALLADEEKSMLEAYGVWKEKSMYGRKYMGVQRTTFLIDGKGVVREVWPKVKVPGHAKAVLEAVKALG